MSIIPVPRVPRAKRVSMFQFSFNSAIRGFHVYKDIWENPVTGEELLCRREVGNSHDALSVAVLKEIGGENTIIGHVPRRISGLCNIFIRRGGSILCIVDGGRRYSADLPQGGLEVPCKLVFRIEKEELCKKTEKMICDALSGTTFSLDTVTHKVPVLSRVVEDWSSNQPNGMSKSECSTSVVALGHEVTNTPKVDHQLSTSQPCTSTVDYSIVLEQVICSPPKKRHKKFDEEGLIMGEKLTDMEIDFAQQLLKSQFPHINGLESTLIQQKAKLATDHDESNDNKIQIVFCNDREH